MQRAPRKRPPRPQRRRAPRPSVATGSPSYPGDATAARVSLAARSFRQPSPSSSFIILLTVTQRVSPVARGPVHCQVPAPPNPPPRWLSVPHGCQWSLAPAERVQYTRLAHPPTGEHETSHVSGWWTDGRSCVCVSQPGHETTHPPSLSSSFVVPIPHRDMRHVCTSLRTTYPLRAPERSYAPTFPESSVLLGRVRDGQLDRDVTSVVTPRLMLLLRLLRPAPVP